MTQIEFIAKLFDDLGFTGPQRRDWLALRYNGKRYADELNTGQRSFVIDKLLSMKDKPAEEEEE